MEKLRATLAAFGLILSLSGLGLAGGCSGSGLCVSGGGSPDECHEGWTEAECQDWNDKQVNGASWAYQSSGTCEERGFTAQCSSGTWVYDSGSCF